MLPTPLQAGPEPEEGAETDDQDLARAEFESLVDDAFREFFAREDRARRRVVRDTLAARRRVQPSPRRAA